MIPTRIRKLIAKTANFRDKKVMFHPEPNVNNHLAQVGTLALAAKDNWEVCYAAILHDIAKNTHDDKKWAQHANRGAQLVASDVPDKVWWLISQHMRAIDFTNGKMGLHKRNALKEHRWFDDLMRLHKYDTEGRKEDADVLSWDTIYDELDKMDPRVAEVTMMIGIQASGKSTISRAMENASRDVGDWWRPGIERTCKDEIRLICGAGPGAYRHQEKCVHGIQQQAIRMALGRGQAVVIDNCHNTVKRRRDMHEWLRREFPGITVMAHLTYAPLGLCIERNHEQGRHRVQIPDNILKQFHGDMLGGFNGKINDDAAIIRQLTQNEGFDAATITRTA